MGLLRQKTNQSLKIIKREALSELNRVEILIAALLFFYLILDYFASSQCLKRPCYLLFGFRVTLSQETKVETRALNCENMGSLGRNEVI